MEFVELMGEFKRFCTAHQFKEGAAYECDGCPLEHNTVCVNMACGVTADDVRDLELLVSDWAEKNPAPIYPSWFEYLRGIGIIPETIKEGYMSQTVYEATKKQIPEDIAKLLGLQPKEN